MRRLMKKRLLTVIAVFAVAIVAGAGIYVGTAADTFGDDDGPITGPELERAIEAALTHVGEGQVTETEMDDGFYEVEVTRPDGTQVDVHLDKDFNVARTEEEGLDGDDDAPITGPALERATQAALDHVGEGQVTDTELDDDGYYEVEVTRPDGTQVDVHLDMDFNVLRAKEEGHDD